MSDKDRYNFAGMFVLVVDDNAFARQLIARICHSLGFGEVIQADGAEAAHAILRQKPIDLVVCDWAMQPIDGIDFTKAVRTAPDSPNPFVPIIMLTGFTEYENVTRARDAGVHEFLAKPVSPHALLARIANIIEHPRPFVRIGTYFGPDRRRKQRVHPGPERRSEALVPGTGGKISKAEVASMLAETKPRETQAVPHE